MLLFSWGLWTAAQFQLIQCSDHGEPPSVNTHRLLGRVLGVNPADADPKCKGSLWIREVVLKSQMHILDLQLEPRDTRVELERNWSSQRGWIYAKMSWTFIFSESHLKLNPVDWPQCFPQSWRRPRQWQSTSRTLPSGPAHSTRHTHRFVHEAFQMKKDFDD